MGNPSQSYGASPATCDDSVIYLSPDTGERAPSKSQPDKLVLILPTLKGWKAKLTLKLVIY